MSAQRVFLQSIKKPELRYEIVSFDEATKRATLKGERGTFTIEPFTKAKITADGYKLVRENGDATGAAR